jgi:peroxiredoxin
MRLYISPDKLLSRVETDMPQSPNEPQHQYFEADLTQLSVNHPIPAQRFAFTPTGQIASDVSPNSQSRLPAVGALAPDFSLRTLSGKALTLQEILSGKKAVYLDFWFCDCMVCRHEFPALQRLYATLKGQGVTVYAVDALDDSAKVRRYKAQMDLLKSAMFPILLAAPGDLNKVSKKYGVEGYPSGILIGADGRVRFTSIGYDDKLGLRDLKAALVKAGLRP